MTHQLIEASVEDGQPMRCYEFQRGTLRWRYTSADRDVTINNMLFRGNVGISDEGMQFTGDPKADALTIIMPSYLEIPLMYRVIAPADTIYVVVWDAHFGQPTGEVAWTGIVTGHSSVTEDLSHITCESIVSSLEIPGLRLGWQRSCPFTLYDPETCRLNKADYEVVAQIADKDGATIHSARAGDFSDGYFSGGFVEWEIEAGLRERRGVQSHTGTQLLLLGGTYGIEVGSSVFIFPGCFRTAVICSNKFDNILNYGGIPHLEGRSPFDGSSVW